MHTTFFTEGLDRQDCEPEPACDPRPACPACGGLDCLCRPRFFAGQLLTEDDLNRLERYVVEKNRLHNRYLHGTGVACGLEVVCAACDESGGRVVVQPGYALSPCGNDIILCRKETVDICALIDRCRPQRPDECLEPEPQQACPDGPEQWVLALCYDERPSRGITALRGESGCACGNGACGGGCGCKGNPAPRKAARPAPPQCEPTLVCEGYSFRVFKAPPKPRNEEPGELARRLWCCMRALIEQLDGLPLKDAGGAVLLDWHRRLRSTVRDFLLTEGLYDCEAARRLAALPEPGPNDERSAWEAKTWAVLAIAIGIVQKCMCAALLPPCPPPAAADCVPLATITVRRSPCRVVRICNLSARRFLLTMPNIEYWLSWLPLLRGRSARSPTLRAILERLCCVPVEEKLPGLIPRVQLTPAESEGPFVMAPDAGGLLPRPGSVGDMLRDALAGKRPVDAGTLLLAAIDASDTRGKPLLSTDELDAPVTLLMIHEVLAPALRTLLPGDHDTKPPPAPPPDAAGVAAQLAELARTVGELRATVDRQQRTIDSLGGTPPAGAAEDQHGPA